MSAASEKYTDVVFEKLKALSKSQEATLSKVASLIFESLKKGKVWNLFGSGHSSMALQEAFHRAGGLVPVNPWLEEYLMPQASPKRNGPMERLSGVAQIVFNFYKPEPGEILVIISNSGINAASVEMAQIAKKYGLVTVAITNLEHSKNTPSRLAGGQKLFEICDYVIDTGGVKGDAVVSLPKLDVPVGPLSTILASYIINNLVVRVCELYALKEEVAPVYLSANLPGADERNHKLEDKYRSRIPRL